MEMISIPLVGNSYFMAGLALAVYLPFFFFQAEDGIRARTVTGVQTCALPISSGVGHDRQRNTSERSFRRLVRLCSADDRARPRTVVRWDLTHLLRRRRRTSLERDHPAAEEIGRAPCRERLGSAGAADTVRKRK